MHVPFLAVLRPKLNFILLSRTGFIHFAIKWIKQLNGPSFRPCINFDQWSSYFEST